MARSYRPVIRDQEFLLPPNMADWLGEDHLVWFVLDVVDQLETARFHAKSRRGGVGRQGYDPDMLLALLIYAYAVGERSSRRIERLCGTDVAFRVLCGSDAPDHTTIARFRADHQGSFAEVFAQVLRLCSAAGMVKVGVVSIDGTKIAANAARGATRSRDAVREEARRIARQIVEEAAVTDVAEDRAAAGRDRSDDDLPPGFDSHSGRAANIKRALDELGRQDAEHTVVDDADRARAEEFLAGVEAGGAAGAPPAGVDPVRFHQARVRRFRAVIEELDGVPGRVASSRRREARRKLKHAEAALAAAQQTAAAGMVDLRGRSARLRDRQAAVGRSRALAGRAVNVTDPDSRLMNTAGGGSVQGYNAQLAVTDDHLIVGVHLSRDGNDKHCFVPTLAAVTETVRMLGCQIDTVLADAGYFTRENLTTPGPNRLIAPGKNHAITTGTRDDPAAGPPPDSDDADPLEVMRHRLRDPANADVYKRRSATVEPVIAHLKDQIGLRRFARRGLQAVTAELHLAAAAVNLNRLHQAALATT
jgi:transposase